MATLKQRLHRKNASGTYDTVHFESTSDLILRPSGRTVEQDLADYLPEVQNNDNVPESLKFVLGITKTFANGKELAYKSEVSSGGFIYGEILNVRDAKTVNLSRACKVVLVGTPVSWNSLAALLLRGTSTGGNFPFSLNSVGTILSIPESAYDATDYLYVGLY